MNRFEKSILIDRRIFKVVINLKKLDSPKIILSSNFANEAKLIIPSRTLNLSLRKADYKREIYNDLILRPNT